MNVRKGLRRLALGALVGGMVLSSMPAALASGSSGDKADPQADVVDYLKHSQNSFRPSTSPFPSPYTSYQKACKPDSLAPVTDCNSLDLVKSSVSSDSTAKKITFKLDTKSAIPPRGAPVTVLPAPFTGINYAWYFATQRQETAHKIGISCSGVVSDSGQLEDDFSVTDVAAPGDRYGASVVYNGTSTQACPSASTATKESQGVSDGTKQVANRSDVMAVPHPRSDGWQAFVEVSMAVVGNGAPRLDGGGTVACAGGAAVCIDYEMSLGAYEGYSGVSTSNSELDFANATQSAMSFNITGTTITAVVPWDPKSLTPDGDGLVDDERSFPWVLGDSALGGNNKITQLTAEVTGLVGVGVNTVPQIAAVCEDNSNDPLPESAEPIHTVSKTFGDVNQAIGEETDIYAWGNGGSDNGDCIRGITGLLTLLDWTDNGFELRIYPRNPSYLPSATSVQCRYPIGEHPGAIVLVANLTLAPTEAPSVDVDTSPFDKAYSVKVFTGSGTPFQSVSGPPVANPAPVSPLAGTIGKDQACGYTYHAPGLHYFDILSPDVTM